MSVILIIFSEFNNLAHYISFILNSYSYIIEKVTLFKILKEIDNIINVVVILCG
jgi:hypothetical protein